VIPSALPIPKLSESIPRANLQKGPSFAVIQQQHLSIFHQAQAKRQALFHAEMKRQHKAFVINDLDREKTFRVNQAKRAEDAEAREDEQTQQYEQLSDGQRKDFRIMVISAESRFSTSESSCNQAFLREQQSRRSQFAVAHESIQSSCYEDEKKRIIGFMAWESEVRASAERTMHRWISEFEDAERKQSELFESFVVSLKTSIR